MKFAAMLAMDVKPQQPTRPAQEQAKKGHRPAHKARMKNARAAYESVMGEWICTRDIEARLGMARCSAYDTLERYRAGNLVERRPLNNEPWNQRRGWEGRWVK